MNAVTRARLARTRVGIDFTENQPGPVGTHVDATGTAPPTGVDAALQAALQAGIDEPGIILGKVESQAAAHPGLFAAGSAVAVAAAAAVVLVLVLVLRR